MLLKKAKIIADGLVTFAKLSYLCKGERLE